jgi:hypothetical protein
MPGKGKTSGWEAFRDRAEIYETTMIAAEKHEAFETLLRELYEEFFPNGTTEEDLIHRLAVLRWERDRLYRYEQSKMEMRQAELNRQLPYAQYIAKIRSHALEFKTAKLAKEFKAFVSGADDTPHEVDDAIEKEPVIEKDRDPKTSGNDFLEEMASLPEVGPANGREIFLKLVEEFPITERLKQLEQIDVVIDRTIKRLMQVKTMKQIFRHAEPKVISASQEKKVRAETR